MSKKNKKLKKAARMAALIDRIEWCMVSFLAGSAFMLSVMIFLMKRSS